jgi:hypothetical protein
MKGHIRKRGNSWAIVIDVRDPVSGERKRRWHSFKGGKRDAELERARLIASVGQGSYVEHSKMLVAEFVRARVDQWEGAGNISARTA